MDLRLVGQQLIKLNKQLCQLKTNKLVKLNQVAYGYALVLMFLLLTPIYVLLLSFTSDQFRIGFMRQHAQRAADAAALAAVSNQIVGTYAREYDRVCGYWRRNVGGWLVCGEWIYYTKNYCNIIYVNPGYAEVNAKNTLLKNWPSRDKSMPENIVVELTDPQGWYVYPAGYRMTVPPPLYYVSGYWGSRVSFDTRIEPVGWKVVNPKLGSIVIRGPNRISAKAKIQNPSLEYGLC